jgi:hypothetical protein
MPTKTIRVILRRFVAALALPFVTVFGPAPDASADAQGYLLCVKGSFAGEDVPTANALDVGRNVENLLDQYNQPPEAVVNNISHHGFSPSEAQAIVACVQRNKPLN